MKNKVLYNIIITAIVVVLSAVGCSENGRLDHIDNSADAPYTITVKSVRPIPGGAVIKYDLPDDENFAGVMVTYVRNGVECQSKASKYYDSLTVEGFGNTDPQVVKLYSFGRNEKLSEAVQRTIYPDIPPIKTVKFELEESFGGVAASLSENYSKAAMAIVLMGDTAKNGKYEELQTFHTSSEAIKFARRGLAVKEMNFFLYLRDRWGNLSDTIYRTLTPILEEKLEKWGWERYELPGDTYESAENNGHPVELMWDGGEEPDWSMWASSHNSPIPQSVTINLNERVAISRIRKWPRKEYEVYSGPAPRTFELYGCLDEPNPDGSWDDWHLLGSFEQFKPSGYGELRDVGAITDEDKEYWYNQTEFELLPSETIPDPYQTVQYIRLKITSTYNTYGTESNMSQVIIAEITLYGQTK